MVYDHEQQLMSLYFDGVLTQSKTHQFTSTTSNDIDICIGKTLRLNVYYKGYVDDIFFFGRAINECEIEALYSGHLLEER